MLQDARSLGVLFQETRDGAWIAQKTDASGHFLDLAPIRVAGSLEHDQVIAVIAMERAVRGEGGELHVVGRVKGALAEQIGSRLEETGRIATSDKAAIVEQAKTHPDIVLTAFKSVKVGASVPIGTFGIKQGAGDGSAINVAAPAPRSPHDNISASKAFRDLPKAEQDLHLQAVQYADKYKCSYIEARKAVESAKTV